MNSTIRNDLMRIAGEAMEYMEPGDAVLDIGANDGTLLRMFDKQIEKIGVEPADNLQESLQKNADVVIHDFWKYEDYMEGKAQVVTAIGMFYDLEDPIEFLTGARKALHKDGVFIAQLMCAKQMAENLDIGNLCHEHLEFYTLKSLKYLFEKSGLEIFEIQENDINGGSYRVFARHPQGDVGEFPEEEKIDWDRFARNIATRKREVQRAVQRAVDKGLKVFAYGASTKGNTILQYFELGPDVIQGAADKDEEKWGRYMLNGTPIVSEEDGRFDADVFLILPYAFTKAFVSREAFWLRGRSNYFIRPLPTVTEIYK